MEMGKVEALRIKWFEPKTRDEETQKCILSTISNSAKLRNSVIIINLHKLKRFRFAKWGEVTSSLPLLPLTHFLLPTAQILSF